MTLCPSVDDLAISTRSTGLLVSVRDADEARAALAGGADVIDVKEPLRGSLGAADIHVWRDVVEAVAGRRTVSVALGELTDVEVLHRARHAHGVRFAKVGLHGCRALPNWRDRWEQVRRALPTSVCPVAVHYADWENAGSPELEEVLAEAVKLQCVALLIDTFDKSAGSLLQQVPTMQIAEWLAAARCAGMASVIAGSLDNDSVATVMAWQPAMIAVRGAACEGTRTGRIVESRVRQLKGRIEQFEADRSSQIGKSIHSQTSASP